MNNTLTRTATLLLAVASLAFGNGNNGTKNAAVSVQVVTPIRISNVKGLSFGAIVIDPSKFTAGGMSIDPSGTLSTAFGGGTWIFSGTGQLAPSAAQFSVTGQQGFKFGFLAPTFVVTHPDGSTMPISPIFAIVDGVAYGTVSSTVTVGGQLSIGLFGKPKPGLWSGTFQATAFYM
jgi:hypothetical protein